MSSYDVIVIGGGNAGLCAALAAQERNAKVLVLERAPQEWRGGNSSFTGGLFRAPYNGVDDLFELMPDLSEGETANAEFGTYPESAFFDDLANVSGYRADPDLTDLVVNRSKATLLWMREHGVRFLPPFGRRTVESEGKTVFQSGAAIEASGGGWGLIEMLYNSAEKSGIEVEYNARAHSLISDDGIVSGVRVRTLNGDHEILAPAVIVASGGFSSNAAWRAAYLGPGWDLARVRGTRFNTGDGISMALEVGAETAGNWSGCHATPWELYAPEFGDPKMARSFFRAHYNFGIMVNRNGDRFVDEGENFKDFTYAKFGKAILEQPGHFAWQVFDSQVEHLLGREEYRSGNSTRVTADTIEDLAVQLDGVNADRFLNTVRDYNAAVDRDAYFDPATLDGKATTGIDVAKSNWATPIEQGPFEAFAVTGGITFTFGGLRVDTNASVVQSGGDPIPGLYAAGEIVGGLFFGNYAAGSGLTTGSVMGKIAGESAVATTA